MEREKKKYIRIFLKLWLLSCGRGNPEQEFKLAEFPCLQDRRAIMKYSL